MISKNDSESTKINFESISYNLSLLLGDDDLNLQIGSNITGETKVSELILSGNDFTEEFDYDTKKCSNYFLNIGYKRNDYIEFIFGLSLWDVSTELTLKESSIGTFNTKYAILNFGVGIVF